MSKEYNPSKGLGSEARAQLVEFQAGMLSKISHDTISRGASFDQENIRAVVERYFGEDVGKLRLLNAGCGPGDKVCDAQESLADIFYESVGVDINANAIDQAKQTAKEMSRDDVRFIEYDLSDDSVVEKLSENGGYDVIVCEAVMCNQPGDSLERSLANLEKLLNSGGIFLFADCLKSDIDGADEILRKALEIPGVKEKLSESNKFLGGEEKFMQDFLYWQQKWIYRYEQNRKAGIFLEEIDIPMGTFMVIAPTLQMIDMRILDIGDEMKVVVSEKDLEYGDAVGLMRMYEKTMRQRNNGESEEGIALIERFARHFERQELHNLLTTKRLERKEWHEVVWWSRTGEPILGVMGVYQKL